MTPSQTILADGLRSLEPLTLLDGLARRTAHRLLSRIATGQLTLVEAGQRTTFGRPGGLSATVTVHDAAAYRALLLAGSLGAGQAYMKGHWSADDLAALARILTINLDALEAMEGGAARLSRAVTQLQAATRRNTRNGSRRNIAYHYDLSNDFFRLFLDDSMMYSSAIFEHQGSTLEDAQRTKLDRICQKLALAPRDHLLEIGTGWGALAIHAAARYGCRVTTTTVSKEQYLLARERVRSLGLSELVTVLLRDYRDLSGTYDKVVSVEMIEAVGHEYMDDYFRACARHLVPDGLMLLQAITISDQHQEAHRTSVDFIKEHIFPGSCIPSVTTIVDSTTRATDMRLIHMEDLTPHYARTLREWRQRFMANAPAVKRLGFDDAFVRMWEYYLAYCEGGFEERYLGSVQMTFARPGARRAPIR